MIQIGKQLILISLLFLSISLNAQEMQNEYLSGDVMQAWEGGRDYYKSWVNGPTVDAKYFPIGVWYQDPTNAINYKSMGANFFLYANSGLNLFPLTSTGMTITPTTYATTYASTYALYAKTVTSWINVNDELDMGSSPMTPAVVINDYNKMVAKDPTRPIMINVGPCVSINNCAGRGNRSNHPEDFYEYAKGADILSFDVYPMNTYADDPTLSSIFANAVAGKLNIIGIGVDKLRMYSNYKKPVMAILECTNILNDKRCKLTPGYIKPEAWIAIIHGAGSLAYFCHTMTPIDATGVLNNPEMVAAIRTNCDLIQSNATILNSQTVENATTVFSDDYSIIVKQMTKRHNGYTYVYAVAEQQGTTNATFTLRGFIGNGLVQVIGENRQLITNDGVFSDSFSNYSVHIYRIETPGKIQTSISDVKSDSDDFKVYQSQEQRTFNFESSVSINLLEIYTLNGKKILTMKPSQNQGVIQVPESTQGSVLIIKAVTNHNIYVRKIVI